MKAKSVPEDFRVFEIADIPVRPVGRFAVYTLRKRGMGTLEAVDRIAGLLRIPRRRIAFMGLKDRWALTEQAISIDDGPPRDLDARDVVLLYRGRRDEPLRPGDFSGNRFEITIRDLSEGDVTHLGRGLQEVRACGLPNYFDSQRFGCARAGEGFAAERLLRRDYEGALRLAIATPSRDDRGRLARLRRLLAERWGSWEQLATELPERTVERRIAAYLARRPADFAGAFRLLRRPIRRLHVYAFQSFLWNEVLRRKLEASGVPLIRRAYLAGSLLFHRTLPDGWVGTRIPLPRAGLPEAPPELLQVLSERDLKLEGLRLRGMGRGVTFPPGDREALVFPADLSEPAVSRDEANPGRLKARLSFRLPRGSYATLLLKRLFH